MHFVYVFGGFLPVFKLSGHIDLEKIQPVPGFFYKLYLIVYLYQNHYFIVSLHSYKLTISLCTGKV